jgi:Rrf2 family protein
MAANTRFVTGVHILVILSQDDALKTSSELAEELNTNPVVVRRILSSLQQARLIVSHKGPSGGSKLIKPAKSISLADVHRALESGSGLKLPKTSSPVATKVHAAVSRAYRDCHSAFERELEQVSIAQLLKKSQRAR